MSYQIKHGIYCLISRIERICMKIRNDFVSNSSSSSFMLVGQEFDGNEIAKAWMKLHPKDEHKFDNDFECYDDDADVYKESMKLANELGLKVEYGISDYYGQYVFGLDFDDMEENETKKQFMDRVKSLLEKAFENVNVHVCIDGGYDG